MVDYSNHMQNLPFLNKQEEREWLIQDILQTRLIIRNIENMDTTNPLIQESIKNMEDVSKNEIKKLAKFDETPREALLAQIRTLRIELDQNWETWSDDKSTLKAEAYEKLITEYRTKYDGDFMDTAENLDLAREIAP